MTRVRNLAFAALFCSTLLAVPAAGQETYTLSGKWARSNGAFINIPLVGNTPNNCNDLTKFYRSSITTAPYVNTPPTTQGGDMVGRRPANKFGCLTADTMITGPAGLDMTGASFEVPAFFLSKPLPGMTIALSVPLVDNIVQLATSFQVRFPHDVLTTASAPANPTYFYYLTTDGMGNNNLADFRRIKPGAWMTQTGRIAPTFTFCWQERCNQVNDGTREVIVKYAPGPNQFGGTMAHIIQSGPNLSSLAVNANGPAAFLALAGMGIQANGRGYANLLTDYLGVGEFWTMFMTDDVFVSSLMTSQMLITAVSGVMLETPPPPFDQAVINSAIGFPFTTGTVLARNTGTTGLGMSQIVTLTAMGGDTTSMGARNINLVSGSISVTSIGQETPNLNQVKLMLPEPGRAAGLLAGAALMVGMALWRARREDC